MSSIIDSQRPRKVVEIAVGSLQAAGIQLIEWGSLLYNRMGVPMAITTFSYVVPDSQLEEATRILESIGLLPPAFSEPLCSSIGDLISKGVTFRITQSDSESEVQHIILYPLSFPDFARSELEEAEPSHMWRTECSNVLVPKESAVYASMMRIASRYPKLPSPPTRSAILVFLGMLNLYHLLRYTLEDVNEDLGEDEEEKRVSDAIDTIRRWGVRGEWREGEEWIEDALVANLFGKDWDRPRADLLLA